MNSIHINENKKLELEEARESYREGDNDGESGGENDSRRRFGFRFVY